MLLFEIRNYYIIESKTKGNRLAAKRLKKRCLKTKGSPHSSNRVKSVKNELKK